jgi:ribosomal protein S18 acetylase RimI-like enzyme
VRVRTLAEADLEACLDLFEAVAAEGRWLANELPLHRGEIRARWRDLLAGGEGTLFVAEDGGLPAGLAAMVGRDAPELGMLVRADRRRSGIGEALLLACFAWARERGAREVVLHVFPHNHAAIALYRKHGFEERERVAAASARRSGERWDALRMVRPLAEDRHPSGGSGSSMPLAGDRHPSGGSGSSM